MEKGDRFYELSEDTKEEFFEVFNKKTFPLSIDFLFIGDAKQKSMIKIAKVADDYAFSIKKQLKVTINEDMMSVYDEESIRILFEQEIDKVNIDSMSGKIKMKKTDLNTFSGIVNKFGIEKVARANKVEELYQQQKEDGTSESVDGFL